MTYLRARRTTGAAAAAGTAVALMVATGAATGTARAQQFDQPTVVLNGLFNPRGLTVGADGALYVAEAGSGGNGPGLVNGDGQTQGYGATGGITRYFNGSGQRIVSGLPSLASQGGAQPGGGATGLHDLAFDASGNLFGVVGFGADPALRSTLGAVGNDFGQLVRFNLATGTFQNVADISAFETANDPGREGADSNPYSLVATPGGGFVVADAGANALLNVSGGGNVSLLSVFPVRPNPLPFGPPAYQAVPNSVTIGPDGTYYVGQLTGFPFIPGAANVFRVPAGGGAPTPFLTGFTNIIDLTFGPDGGLYVLQLTTNGLASPTGPGSGALIRVDPLTGARTTIADQRLFFPTSMTFGKDGSLYVSNVGVAAGGGQVLRFAPAAIPEPGTLGLLAGGGLLPLMGAIGRRRRQRRGATKRV